MNKHIVVIGGGMAGCAAAYSLRQRGYSVTIIEKNDYIGGRIYSQKGNGHDSDMGAVFVTNFYTNILSFLRQTGLDKNLQEQKNETFIARDGALLSSKRLATYLGNSWLSLGAKLRLIKEVVALLPIWSRLSLHQMWRATSLDTQSVTQRFPGKYGQELLDYLFGPILNGYMYWSPERTSQAFHLMLLKTALTWRHSYVLKGGLQQIPELAAKGSHILLSCNATSVERQADDTYIVSVMGPDGEQTLSADGIVCATTASVIPQIFADLTSRQAAFFSSVHYSSTVVAAYQTTSSSSSPASSYAIAYPSLKEQRLAAIVVTSDVTTSTCNIKLYTSGVIGKELGQKSDKKIRATLTKALPLNLEPTSASDAWRIQRWPEALPEFNVGYLRKLQSFASGEIEIPHSKIVFAGDYIGGPFIEGAFTSGIQAAARLHTQL